MPEILNLRKKNNDNNTAKNGNTVSSSLKKSYAPKITENKHSIQKDLSPISWEVTNDLSPQKKYLLSLILLLAGSGGTIIFLGRDTLTAILLFVASFTLSVFLVKKPEILAVRLDQISIQFGEASYAYRDLQSFWIEYEPGLIKELSIESKKWYYPHIKIPLGSANPLAVRSILIQFLPEKEHDKSVSEAISRKIGL